MRPAIGETFIFTTSYPFGYANLVKKYCCSAYWSQSKALIEESKVIDGQLETYGSKVMAESMAIGRRQVQGVSLMTKVIKEEIGEQLIDLEEGLKLNQDWMLRNNCVDEIDQELLNVGVDDIGDIGDVGEVQDGYKCDNMQDFKVLKEPEDTKKCGVRFQQAECEDVFVGEMKFGDRTQNYDKQSAQKDSGVGRQGRRGKWPRTSQNVPGTFEFLGLEAITEIFRRGEGCQSTQCDGCGCYLYSANLQQHFDGVKKVYKSVQTQTRNGIFVPTKKAKVAKDDVGDASLKVQNLKLGVVHEEMTPPGLPSPMPDNSDLLAERKRNKIKNNNRRSRKSKRKN